ncbi:MAG: DUF177 domain-containing protein [Rubrobacteraceae bacterium]
MNNLILLKRPGAELGVRREYRAAFEVPDFKLYGREHEVLRSTARVGVTPLAEGLHLDLRVSVEVRTTCDRTLEPMVLDLEFGDSELVNGPDDRELSIQDWTLDLARYTGRALPSEVPIKACAPGTEPVQPGQGEEDVDPRWRGLDGLFAIGF